MAARDQTGLSETDIKACCATAYQSEWARWLLGDSFHPGGMPLTERLGEAIRLGPGQRVLDVAAGQGASAIYLAQRFECSVLGVEYSAVSVRQANEAAETSGVSHLVAFQQGDAEYLPVADDTFDAIVCECAFCTFPDKPKAAAEFARVLKRDGRVGLADLTRQGPVPDDLRGLLAWIACIADAQPLVEYARYLGEAGLRVDLIEPHDEALSAMAREIQGKLLGAEMLARLEKLDLPPTVDLDRAKALARSAKAAIAAGMFGYAVITATKAPSH